MVLLVEGREVRPTQQHRNWRKDLQIFLDHAQLSSARRQGF